jgi:hypothetical protein
LVSFLESLHVAAAVVANFAGGSLAGGSFAVVSFAVVGFAVGNFVVGFAGGNFARENFAVGHLASHYSHLVNTVVNSAVEAMVLQRSLHD